MRRTLSLLFGSVLTIFSGATGCGSDGGGAQADMTVATPVFEANCTASAPVDAAKIPAGKQADGSVILLGGRRISPAGKILDVGGFPLAMRVLPGDRYVVVTDGAYGDEALRIVDLSGAPHDAVVSKVDYPMNDSSSHDPALFYGLAVTRDGKRLYVSNGGHDPVADTVKGVQHYNTIDVFDLTGSPPQLVRNDALQLHLLFNPLSNVDGSAVPRLPAGITLSSDETLLYVATQNDATLAVLDLRPGGGYGTEIGRAALPGVGPYDVAIDAASHTAYVSMWGGAKLSGNLFTDGVATVDVTDPSHPVAAPMLLATGKGAEGELIFGGHLYVASADGDSLTSFDLSTKMGTPAPIADGSVLGRSPGSLAVDATAMRLYVANAGENSVEAMDLATMKPLGRIPTAWYPTAVATLGDGTVLIASAKGLGLGPTNHSKGKNDFMQGVLQIVPRPSASELGADDKVVADNLARPKSYEAALHCPATGTARFPLPATLGAPSPISHVFLIVRENKTYDAVLGDLAGANGDKSLVLFGANVTPNLHALASTFTNLDNFYSNAEQSLQGHEWTTAGISNDYTEKAWLTTWGRADRPVGAFASGFYEHLGHPGSDTIWIHLDKAMVAYHNYGEVVNTTGALKLADSSYPGVFFDLNKKDVEKIQYVIDQMNDPSTTIEPFSYIGLPNDHTYGTTPGKLSPESMVADNDEATGRFIDALSHSKLWSSSIVFIIEDDPQDGGDHVEGHRSPCVVVSPWIKRGYVSSVNTDVPSLMKTIMLLLGTPPLNIYDANAAAFYDSFATRPDLTPYTFIPRNVKDMVNPMDAPLSDVSSRIDWSRPDSAPLGRILWKAVHGKKAEPPWGPTDSPMPRSRHAADDDD